jgi:hypothetical protein
MESLLKSLVGHNVSLSFTVHEEGDLRDSEGVLMDFNEDFIHLKMFDNFGLTSDYYLNRHASTLHSITDFGKEKVSG